MNEEFELLKRDAQEMGVKFRSDIGQDKLQERVDAAIADADVPKDARDSDNDDMVEYEKDKTVDAEPALENGFDPEVEQDISEEETWVDRVAMVMLNRGHGQRNVLLRTCRKAGLNRRDGYAKFVSAKGNSMRERLLAIFK